MTSSANSPSASDGERPSSSLSGVVSSAASPPPDDLPPAIAPTDRPTARKALCPARRRGQSAPKAASASRTAFRLSQPSSAGTSRRHRWRSARGQCPAAFRQRAGKKKGSCTGKAASNSIGASSNIMAQLIIKCTNAERNIVTRPKYKGTPFAL